MLSILICAGFIAIPTAVEAAVHKEAADLYIRLVENG